MASYVYATNEAPRLATSPGGFFCTVCPTAVVDVDIVKKACKHGILFKGIVGLEAPGKGLNLFKTWNGGHLIHLLNDDGSAPQGILTFDEKNLLTDSGDGILKPGLSIMPDPKRQIIRLKHAKYAGRDIMLRILVCDDPFCGCMNAEFYPFMANAPSQKPGLQPYFRLDLSRKCIQDRQAFQRQNPENLEIADAFLAELTDKDWDDLRRFFWDEKGLQEKHCSPSDPRARFPRKMILDGEMIPYTILFPLAKKPEFSRGEDSLCYLDQYDPQDGPASSEMILQFYRVPTFPEAVDRTIDPICVIRFDYSRQTIREIIMGKEREAASLLADLGQSDPEFQDELRRRHNLMKSLFQVWKERHGFARPVSRGEIPVRSSFEPGRNDPCPCGSGKKYKKCCG